LEAILAPKVKNCKKTMSTTNSGLKQNAEKHDFSIKRCKPLKEQHASNIR